MVLDPGVNAAMEEELAEGEEAALLAEEEPDGSSGFFACYLLCSDNPRSKGRTYIGFTVNPQRRLRQHNGQLKQGAWLTKKNRPWDMILCVHGFLSQVDALQFEWAWQHPLKSLAVREAAAKIQMRGVRGKVLLLFTMLNCAKWQRMNLSLQFFSTKYAQLRTGCPPLPTQMRVSVAPMDALPCYGTAEPELDDMDTWVDDAPTSPPPSRQVESPCSSTDQAGDEPFQMGVSMDESDDVENWMEAAPGQEQELACPSPPLCQNLPLGEVNWLSRLDCSSPSCVSKARRKVQKVVPGATRNRRAAGAAFPPGSEIVVIGASPVPVRREVIVIEDSPVPVCREVIVIEDSPM